MTLKKFYAPSINEARKKAQDALGQTYIVVETKEAINDNPAWVHVLDDSGKAANNNAATYSRRDLFPKALTKLKETVNDSLQLFTTGNEEADDTNSQAAAPEKTARPRMEAPKLLNPGTYEPPDSSDTKEQPHFEKELETLNNRFDQLEKLVSGQTVGVNVQVISHPAFQQLLSNGVPHATISHWFNEILGQGIDPYYQRDRFMPLLAQKVRKTLDVAAKNEPASYMLFTGSPGSGKSSLMMKLVLHSNILENARCALVSICPPNANHFYSPLASFAAACDIAFFELKVNKELSKWKAEWSNFDHVLIEMPDTGSQLKSGNFSVDTFRQMFPSQNLLEVHHVINATLNQACIDASFLNDRSRADYLDFTHLDGAPQRGHLLPLMQQSGCKVRYVASGPRIPDDISEFEPARFARQLLTTI